jgi:uncharacterized protein (DUF305 family)
MRLTHSSSIAALLMASICGCSRSSQNRSPQPSPQTGSHHQSSSTAATQKTATGQYPFTAADVHFMSGMIGHHAQALVMAGWAPSHGASPAIRTLCERIINGQQDEIATMQRWLKDRGLPVPDATPMKMDMGSMNHELMPGMLTEQQMKDLDQARGPEFDRKFLTYMIQHHRGAITMVQQLFATKGAAQDEATFKMANDISADQTTEVDRMQRMLDSLPPA